MDDHGSSNVVGGNGTGPGSSAEAVLRAEKAFGDTVIDAAPGLFYTTDRTGHLIRWNGALERFTGRTFDQVMGKSVFDFVAPEDLGRAKAALALVFENGAAEAQLRLVGVDGPREFIINGVQTQIAGAPYLVGFGIDVTERVHAEDAVREGLDELERRVLERTHELEAANQRLRRTERALLTLSWSNQTLVRAVDEPQLLQDVCDSAVEVGGYRMAWVGYIEHDEAKSIRPVAFAGAERGFFKDISVGWGDGPDGQGTAGRAVRELRPAIVADTQSDESYAPWRKAAEQRGYGSAVSLPLVDSAGDAFGIFCLFAAEKDAFDDREVALLEELSMDLAFGIESLHSRQKRTEAEDQLHDSYAKLERLTRDVVASMGRIVEARDPYTQGHERRVAELAKLIAEEMGLSDDEIAGIEMAALLHDIGKLCVPAEILTKPGTLSLSEFDLIKDHSRRGYEILKDIAFPWPIADIVLQHHERMDGSGYPVEAQGPEILLASRILAVADVIEAMASHRPYRPLIGLEQAMEEIRQRPGAYDPKVAAACERLYERGCIDL